MTYNVKHHLMTAAEAHKHMMGSEKPASLVDQWRKIVEPGIMTEATNGNSTVSMSWVAYEVSAMVALGKSLGFFCYPHEKSCGFTVCWDPALADVGDE